MHATSGDLLVALGTEFSPRLPDVCFCHTPLLMSEGKDSMGVNGWSGLGRVRAERVTLQQLI
jgi:hypothetical protein